MSAVIKKSLLLSVFVVSSISTIMFGASRGSECENKERGTLKIWLSGLREKIKIKDYVISKARGFGRSIEKIFTTTRGVESRDGRNGTSDIITLPIASLENTMDMQHLLVLTTDYDMWLTFLLYENPLETAPKIRRNVEHVPGIRRAMETMVKRMNPYRLVHRPDHLVEEILHKNCKLPRVMSTLVYEYLPYLYDDFADEVLQDAHLLLKGIQITKEYYPDCRLSVNSEIFVSQLQKAIDHWTKISFCPVLLEASYVKTIGELDELLEAMSKRSHRNKDVEDTFAATLQSRIPTIIHTYCPDEDMEKKNSEELRAYKERMNNDFDALIGLVRKYPQKRTQFVQAQKDLFYTQYKFDVGLTIGDFVTRTIDKVVGRHLYIMYWTFVNDVSQDPRLSECDGACKVRERNLPPEVRRYIRTQIVHQLGHVSSNFQELDFEESESLEGTVADYLHDVAQVFSYLGVERDKYVNALLTGKEYPSYR